MTIETKFNIGERVLITELKQCARIVAIMIAHDGTTFKCRWLTGTSTTSEYFYEDELTTPTIQPAGFNQ